MASTYLCTGYEAYVREIDEPLTTKFWQYVVLYAKSAADTDNVYDFGEYVSGSLGTFWTAAIADTTAVAANPSQGIISATTAGAIATAALGVLRSAVAVQAENFISVGSEALAPLQMQGSGQSQLLHYLSSAAAGGGATETYTVTGLLSTDTVVAVTQDVANANAVYFSHYGAIGDNSLAVTYSGDPGVGGKVMVLVDRATGLVPQAGQYSLAIANKAPNITFSSAGAPTSSTAFVMCWSLSPGQHGVKSPLVYF